MENEKNVTIQRMKRQPGRGIFLPGFGRTRSIGGSYDVKTGAKNYFFSIFVTIMENAHIRLIPLAMLNAYWMVRSP